MAIRGDSAEYELLKKWCDSLPFFENPKSVTTCEVGVREGLGSKIIMMSMVPRLSKTEYQHYAICLLYTSPSPRDGLLSRMPSSA